MIYKIEKFALKKSLVKIFIILLKKLKNYIIKQIKH